MLFISRTKLEVFQKISLASSLLGTIATAFTQQIIYTALPLTTLTAIIFLDKQKQNKLEQNLLKKIEEDITQVKNIVINNQPSIDIEEKFRTLDKQIDSLLTNPPSPLIIKEEANYTLLKTREESLETVHQALADFSSQLLINCPWITEKALLSTKEKEFSLYEIMEAKLSLNSDAEIHIIYGYPKDFLVRSPDTTHSDNLIKTSKKWLYTGISYLRKLEQKYPKRFKLYRHSGGTHAKYLICDNQYVMIGSHNFFTSEFSNSHEIGIVTNNQLLVNDLTQEFYDCISSVDDLDIQDWQILHTYDGFRSWIYDVKFFENNFYLACNDYNSIIINDLDNGESYKISDEHQGHTEIIFSLDISLNRRLIATGSADKTTKLWDLGTGKIVSTLAQKKDPIYSVVFSPDSKVLACGGENKYRNQPNTDKTTSIYLWNVESQEFITTLSGHLSRITSLCFTPDGRFLGSTSNDGTVKIWNMEAKTIHLSLELQASKIILNSQNQLIANHLNTIQVWDIYSSQLIKTINIEIEGCRSFAISPNNKLLAVTAYSKIHIWELETFKLIYELDSAWPLSVNFSPDGSLIAAGHATGFDDGSIVTVWEVPKIYQ